MARFDASVPFAATRTHLLSAVAWSVVWLAALAFGVGLFRGLNTSLDMLFGGAVVLLPTLWVAMNLTSGRSIFGPVWLGLARYTLAGVGFAALFAVRPNSQPLAVLAGSGAALVLPSVLLFWRQRSGERR
ncbi:MAG: hypothetical protein VXA07_01965 [Halieaceae bacterium]